MNTSLLRRFVLPGALTLFGAAQAAEPVPMPDAPASSAATSAQETSEQPEDGQNRWEWHSRHEWRSRHAHGNDLVNIGRDSNLPSGQKADSVVSILGSVTSEGEAEDVVSILGDSRITGEVGDSAVAVLGDVYIDSKIDGNAVAVLGDVELGPHAEVGGNVAVIGGSLQRDPAAIVHGGVQSIFAGDFGTSGGLRTWIHHCLFYARPLALVHGLGWAWGLAFALLALYVGLALLFREGVTRCVQTFENHPGPTVLAALIASLLTPVLITVLCVTVIGIAAVPFVVLTLLCAALFGKAVMLAWLGGRIVGRQGTGTFHHPAVAVLIGGALVLVLYVVPILGLLVFKLLGLLGFGAVTYTLVMAVRAHQAAKEGVPRPATAEGPSVMASATAAASAGAAPAPGPSTDPGPSTAAGPSVGPAPASSAADAAAPHGPSRPAQGAPAVTAALPHAGFWIRMGALLIDVLLVGFFMKVLHHEFHLELIVLAAYGAIMWKQRGSTVGGIVCDLRVVRMDGREVDWETAIVRALGCFLSLAIAGLGFLWIAFDHQKQAWHDKIAGTVVVRVAKGRPLV
jgi:uncharacterized RDD family membrane protein YckC